MLIWLKKWNIIYYKKNYIRIEKKIITKFGEIVFEKKMINQYERPIPIKNIDTNKMIVSNKV